MKTSAICFDGDLVETTPPTAIWKSQNVYLVTLQAASRLKSWVFPSYKKAKRHADTVRAVEYLTWDDLKPKPKLTAADLTWEERYPREYPLTVDWTRI